MTSRKRKARFFIILIICLAIGVLLYFVYAHVGLYTVKGRSMEPTLHSGQRLVVLRTNVVLPGAVVVFKHFDRSGIEQVYVKRCIGVSGDSVRIRDGYFERKPSGKNEYKMITRQKRSQLLESDHYKRLVSNMRLSSSNFADTNWTVLNFGPIYVDIDPINNSECCFMVGDNFVHSRDSRDYGAISKSNIIGSVLFK